MDYRVHNHSEINKFFRKKTDMELKQMSETANFKKKTKKEFQSQANYILANINFQSDMKDRTKPAVIAQK